MADESKVDGDNNTQSGARRYVIAIAAVAVVVLVIVIGVVVGKGDDTTSPSTTVPASTVATVPPAEQKVLSEYRAFWDAYLQASNPMTPDSPALAAHATGEQYKQVVESFTSMKAGNEIIKGEIETAPKIVKVESSSAVVSDCIDDRTGIYDATSGARKDADDPRRRQATATLDLVDGTWKLSHLKSEGFGCTP